MRLARVLIRSRLGPVRLAICPLQQMGWRNPFCGQAVFVARGAKDRLTGKYVERAMRKRIVGPMLTQEAN